MSYILELVAAFTEEPVAHTRPIATYLPLSRSFLSMELSCQEILEAAINTPGCWKDVVLCFRKKHHTSPTVLDKTLRRSKSLLSISPFTWTIRIEVCSGEQTMQLCQITQTMRDMNWSFPALRWVRLVDNTREEIGPLHNIRLIPFWNKKDTRIESVELVFRGCGEVITPHPSLEDLQLPVGQLRHLRIEEGLSKDIVISIARCCPQLEHFEWDYEREEFSLEIKPIELPFLKTFKLSGEPIVGGFPLLIAPHCQNVCLDGLWTPEQIDWLLEPTRGVLHAFPTTVVTRMWTKSTVHIVARSETGEITTSVRDMGTWY
ncbi:hypothetical protein DL93DRAFT_2161439 [Clavulina sp. PMI_390]|nr:hypothetical protein DL93DRAFT_2161439 [Clavulina sp. PMI_390]